MESSNTPNPVVETGAETASSAQTFTTTEASTTAQATPTLETLATSSATPTADAAAEAALSQYNPNWKYKAYGKEKEIEEFWRPLVKDADSEKRVKDVFTRADAFDEIKARFETTQKEHEDLTSNYEALDRDVRMVMKFKADGDYENFFRALRISDEDVFKYAQQRIELMNAPAEQRALLERQAQERQRLYELEEQNQHWQESYQSQAVQARTMQLDMVLSRPDVASVAGAWDSKTGTIGSFRDLIIEEGQKAFYTTGQDLPVEAVVQSVMQRWGKFVEAQSPTTVAQTVANQPQAVAPKPVIPTASGKGTSPIKRTPKSLDDLRQLAKEANS